MIKKSVGGRLWRGVLSGFRYAEEHWSHAISGPRGNVVTLGRCQWRMQMAVDKSFARWNEGTKRGINVIEPPVPLLGPLEFRGGNQLVVYENDLEEIGSKYPLRQRWNSLPKETFLSYYRLFDRLMRAFFVAWQFFLLSRLKIQKGNHWTGSDWFVKHIFLSFFPPRVIDRDFSFFLFFFLFVVVCRE